MATRKKAPTKKQAAAGKRARAAGGKAAAKKAATAKKPAVKKPVAKTKPAVKKPVAKTKPAVKKAATATKPAVKKPAATKPVAAKKWPAAPPPRDTLPADAQVVDADELLWSIIDRVAAESGGDLETAIAAFTRELSALDDAALVAVDASFAAAMARAHDWRLWGAAYVIHGGASDDTFWDFRAGLISLGRAIYEAALRDPESLAEIADIADRSLYEGFQYVPGQLVEARGLERTGGPHTPGEPSGTRWSEEQLAELYPRLSSRFG